MEKVTVGFGVHLFITEHPQGGFIPPNDTLGAQEFHATSDLTSSGVARGPGSGRAKVALPTNRSFVAEQVAQAGPTARTVGEIDQATFTWDGGDPSAEQVIELDDYTDGVYQAAHQGTDTNNGLWVMTDRITAHYPDPFTLTWSWAFAEGEPESTHEQWKGEAGT